MFRFPLLDVVCVLFLVFSHSRVTEVLGFGSSPISELVYRITLHQSVEVRVGPPFRVMTLPAVGLVLSWEQTDRNGNALRDHAGATYSRGSIHGLFPV